MIKKSLRLLLALLSLLCLSGCWNYRGLNEMTVVSGLAIDKSPEGDKYLLTFEIVDTSAPIKDKGPAGKLLKSEGETIFDAIRNAKRKLSNKLYFGHNQIVIISSDVAESQDIVSTVDMLLRDAECRETMCVIISRELTAGEIFESEGIDQQLISYNLHKVITEDGNVTSSTLHVELYEMYETANSPGASVVLPAIRLVDSQGDKKASEVYGLALFDRDRLAGFLPSEDARYFLLATNRFGRGVIPFRDENYQPVFEKGHDTDIGTAKGSLEVFKSKTKLEFEETDGGRLKITVRPTMTAAVGELLEAHEALDKDKVAAIQHEVEEDLNEKITELLTRVQTEFKTDIFGFGNMIYKRKPSIWKEHKDNWDEVFCHAEFEVETKIQITNTALLKKV